MRRDLAAVMEQQQSVIVKLRKVPLTVMPCQINIAKVRLFSWLAEAVLSRVRAV